MKESKNKTMRGPGRLNIKPVSLKINIMKTIRTLIIVAKTIGTIPIIVIPVMTILFLMLLTLCSCGGSEADPAPAYNCEQIAKDVDRAHAAFKSAFVPISDNSTPAAKKAWQEKAEAARQAYIDIAVIQTKHCK